MKALLLFLLSFCLNVPFLHENIKKDNPRISGYFEGNEPFWEMEINDNYFVLHCVNDIVKDTMYFSGKQAHTGTYAFKSDQVYGVLRESSKGGCILDITEDGDPTHEIYFSYKNVTYMGCGKLTTPSLPVFAQQPDDKEKERIQNIQNAVAERENHSIQAVTNNGGVPEFWSFADLNDTIRSMKVWYYHDENLYTEYYVEENRKLIFGFEQELFIPYNHRPQQTWNCAYYLKNDSVFYHISLGHGKTESEEWEPDDISIQFQHRKRQHKGIQEIYRPD